MYLILGNAADPCCAQVSSILRARGNDARVVNNILAEPHCFTWRFARGSRLGVGSSSVSVPGEWRADSDDIEGVLVRESAWNGTDDWSEKDAQYMSAEMQAAMLGWLWSLGGVVVNRPPAWLFYRMRPAFLSWVPLLHDAGLPTPVTVISNDADRLTGWRRRHEDGLVFAPLTSADHFQVRTDAEWAAVLRLAHHVPVVLEEAHGETQLACIVGDVVVWDGAAPDGACFLEERLCRFARRAGLNFVQVALAQQPGQAEDGATAFAVVNVDAQVEFALFCDEAQSRIAEAVADLLTGREESGNGRRTHADRDAAVVGGGAR